MKLKNYIRTHLQDFEAYSSARDDFKSCGKVFLDANESPNNNGLNRYPDNQSSRLTTLLAKDLQLSKQQLLVCNGSDEALDLCIRTICEPKEDKLLYFSPSYGMYNVLARCNNVESIEAYLNQDFQVELDKLEELLISEPIKLIVLCNPNNPTGNLLNVKAVLNLASQYECFVLVDEAYIEFCPSKSSIPLLEQFDNLLITRTFSKAYGLAGIRIGYCIGTEPIITALSKVQLPYSVSTLSQSVAEDAIQNKSYMLAQVRRTVLEREKLSDTLQDFNFVKQVYPSESNFLLFQVEDAKAVYEYLIEQGIIIRNRDQQVQNCLRVSVGNSKENECLINALKQYEKKKSTVLR